MSDRLKGKVAIVTGAASGFGAGMAAKFVAEGAQVLIADRNLELALDVAARLGPAARALRVDVSRAADVQAMVEAAEQHFGRIDILINNAGVTHLPTPLEDVSEEDFDRIFQVNMKAIYLAMRTVVPRMKANAAGHRGIRGVVLNVASTAGVSPRPQLPVWFQHRRANPAARPPTDPPACPPKQD
jgi:3-oxoacyl-[acyl-carrier protein] reductase